MQCPDERDGFISWIRGEFAAANAIIDSLCHHLRSFGEPGEYDLVINSIQQRRCNWNSVLHMQQYFSVAEVLLALQHVASRRQQRNYDQFRIKRSGGSGYVKRAEGLKDVHNLSVDNGGSDSNSSNLEANERVSQVKSAAADDKNGTAAKGQEDGSSKILGTVGITKVSNAEPKADTSDNRWSSGPAENDSNSTSNQNGKPSLIATPKTFVASEMLDGKMVNVLDGLKLYEEPIGNSEVLELVSMANDLRAAGKRGQIQGPAYVISKRPHRGHGREVIQLGPPIMDAPVVDDSMAGTSKDKKIEPIPALLQNVIVRLVERQIMTVKPDSCIIDVYNEGDHSQPHTWPSWFGRPVCVLFLTECEMTFGKRIGIDHPGDYRGALRLSLAPGSLLVMQGESADLAKHAIPSIRKQRILVTFTKSQPRKTSPSDNQRLPSPVVSPPPHWGAPPGRSPNHHIRQPMGPKHYAPIPTTGVLPAPPIRTQVPPPNNGVQPLFVTTPVSPPLPFPAPVPIPPPGSVGWPAALTRHPPIPPRLPLPGTGVFLPPSGSGGSPSTQPPSRGPAEMNSNMTGKPNSHSSASSPKKEPDEKTRIQNCNEIADADGSDNVKAVMKEEQQQNENTAAASKSGIEV